MRGATHNLAVRLALSDGRIDLRQVSDGGYKLFDNYRKMAIANGANRRNPALRECRDD